MPRAPSAGVVAPLLVSQDPITRARASMRSSMSSAPHTPTGDNPPLPLFGSSNTNRYSTDSWNSSTYDTADDVEWEWRPEHLRLLTRTLDNLPAHLLTPFNGPVPPSNLLDKIAKGVSHAKGPIDWPHSLRATRAKIVELARVRAREAADGGDTTDTIAEEETTGSDVPLKQTTNTGPKRPLYRQSSMDFMQTAKVDIKDNDYIRRLSRRLQHTDRVLESPFHPYAHHRSSSPAYGSLRPSTPSSTTLNSTASSSRPFRTKRSMSSLSSASDASRAADPRVQRIILSDSFAGSSRPLKRAPSFGNGSRNSLDSNAMSVDHSTKDSDVTSSDEEEKMRSRKAKKARTKAASPTPPATASLMSPPTSKTGQRPKAKAPSRPSPPSKPPSKVSNTPKSPESVVPGRPTKRRANVRRNPSILGPELPNPQPNLEPPAAIPGLRSPAVGVNSPYNLTRIPAFSPAAGPPASPTSPTSPRPLRRSKPAAALPRLAPSRIIAFGDIPPTSPEKPGAGSGMGLESAFQLN
ncbi:Transcription factor iws1 [Steccherinum ochraceum]|uniref:Transcription factor iws1 n=1 Tax=Steccherinum ochraceum TaxID=92696 RepID=A0A4V2MW50_9APHY|nr:Transcription factor iws1 [Steccherinum ochraceum]